ncbi:MAG: DNA-binding protein [Clostridia bacterium]|nr:DNA-binding protein [Oscillospiraceae bacterium]MBQ7032928.1 DNA-binding protein [Clostridia bacterium]
MRKDDFMKTSVAAEKWKLSQVYLTKLCREGKIPGAIQTEAGKAWHIPVDAENPGRFCVKTKSKYQYLLRFEDLNRE